MLQKKACVIGSVMAAPNKWVGRNQVTENNPSVKIELGNKPAEIKVGTTSVKNHMEIPIEILSILANLLARFQ